MSSTFPAEKLDPRVKRTRNLLEQAFMEVVAEKGFQAVSVQDITEKAGVNRATFYAHFPDKYALLDYTVRQGFRQPVEDDSRRLPHHPALQAEGDEADQDQLVSNLPPMQFGHCAGRDDQHQEGENTRLDR